MTATEALEAAQRLGLTRGWIAGDEYRRWFWFQCEPRPFISESPRFRGMWNTWDSKQVQLNPEVLASAAEAAQDFDPNWCATKQHNLTQRN